VGETTADVGTASAVPDWILAISTRASPMSRNRRFMSRSRQRRSSATTGAGVAEGRACQSMS